jgi:TRAP-type mannitol/chloroaromatic compound transport system permease small subunit
MKFVYAVEGLSLWVGRAFGWCILILTLSVSYEVFVRYVLNAPTVWAFDMMIQMYGALFLMCGAYALAQDTHVRADVVYRLFPVKGAGHSRFRALLPLLFPRHPGPGLVRL